MQPSVKKETGRSALFQSMLEGRSEPCQTKTPRRQFSPGGDEPQQGRTVEDLFSLVESLRGEFTEFRDKVDVRLLGTTPLSETLELVRADVGALAERQTALGTDVAEIAKVSRRIESKINGIAIDFAEIKGTLHHYEERLEALDS